MTGLIPRFDGVGAVTYEVAETVVGGQLIEARGSGKVGVAAAGSEVVLGVATKNARLATDPGYTTETGFTTVDIAHGLVTPYVAVGNIGHWQVTYAANASFGALLKAAANGQVTPWLKGIDDPAKIVGRCVEPAGVVVATSPLGLMKFGI